MGDIVGMGVMSGCMLVVSCFVYPYDLSSASKREEKLTRRGYALRKRPAPFRR